MAVFGLDKLDRLPTVPAFVLFIHSFIRDVDHNGSHGISPLPTVARESCARRSRLHNGRE